MLLGTLIRSLWLCLFLWDLFRSVQTSQSHGYILTGLKLPLGQTVGWRENQRLAAEGVTVPPLSIRVGSYNTLSQEAFLSSVDFKCNVGKSFRCLTPLFCASEVTAPRISMQKNLKRLSRVSAFRASRCDHCGCICFCFPFLRLNHMQRQAYLTMLSYKNENLVSCSMKNLGCGWSSVLDHILSLPETGLNPSTKTKTEIK